MSSSTKAWSSLDRKATAVAEFTLRQYRTRLSTWVVLASAWSRSAPFCSSTSIS